MKTKKSVNFWYKIQILKIEGENKKSLGFLEKTAQFFWSINRFLIGFSFKIQILNGKRQTDQYFRFIARFSGLSPGFLFFQKNIKILKISN
jgi:hypothetical protein